MADRHLESDDLGICEPVKLEIRVGGGFHALPLDVVREVLPRLSSFGRAGAANGSA